MAWSALGELEPKTVKATREDTGVDGNADEFDEAFNKKLAGEPGKGGSPRTP
jgi:hypothetical protein